jgi:hypothetical protein
VDRALQINVLVREKGGQVLEAKSVGVLVLTGTVVVAVHNV